MKMFHNCDNYSTPEKKQPDHGQHRQQTGQRKLPDELQKGRHEDFLPLGDGLDHEVRAVADVSRRAEKNRADADGQNVRRVLLQQP